jgi:hypothetical protein
MSAGMATELPKSDHCSGVMSNVVKTRLFMVIF